MVSCDLVHTLVCGGVIFNVGDYDTSSNLMTHKDRNFYIISKHPQKYP